MKLKRQLRHILAFQNKGRNCVQRTKRRKRVCSCITHKMHLSCGASNRNLTRPPSPKKARDEAYRHASSTTPLPSAPFLRHHNTTTSGRRLQVTGVLDPAPPAIICRPTPADVACCGNAVRSALPSRLQRRDAGGIYSPYINLATDARFTFALQYSPPSSNHPGATLTGLSDGVLKRPIRAAKPRTTL